MVVSVIWLMEPQWWSPWCNVVFNIDNTDEKYQALFELQEKITNENSSYISEHENLCVNYKLLCENWFKGMYYIYVFCLVWVWILYRNKQSEIMDEMTITCCKHNKFLLYEFTCV